MPIPTAPAGIPSLTTASARVARAPMHGVDVLRTGRTPDAVVDCSLRGAPAATLPAPPAGRPGTVSWHHERPAITGPDFEPVIYASDTLRLKVGLLFATSEALYVSASSMA